MFKNLSKLFRFFTYFQVCQISPDLTFFKRDPVPSFLVSQFQLLLIFFNIFINIVIELERITKCLLVNRYSVNSNRWNEIDKFVKLKFTSCLMIYISIYVDGISNNPLLKAIKRTNPR
jgi:hypothetical protein